MVMAIDTETTGLDIYHGCRPFFVTVCDQSMKPSYWEWEVDPVTREVLAPVSDVKEVASLIEDGDGELVLQNSKFDVAGLTELCRDYGITLTWPWHRTHDTLIAAHLLASNQPHDLTSLAVFYAGKHIKPYEVKLNEETNRARRVVQQAKLRARRGKESGWLSEWRLSQDGDPDIPSAGGKDTWRGDTWLPRALATLRKEPKDHPWWTVLSCYGNYDSASTVAVWEEQKIHLKRRKLWALYLERLKASRMAYQIERRGVTVSRANLIMQKEEYLRESRGAGERCIAVAREYDYDLTLPKNGNNASLLAFCYGKEVPGTDDPEWVPGFRPLPRRQQWLNLPVVKYTDNGAPSLDKESMAQYLGTLDADSPQCRFVRALADKRKRDKALENLANYERFWIPLDIHNEQGEQAWYLLHPFMNPTGTMTLRWSSNNPNEQNVSKKEGFNLRYCFGPAPGREWWSFDYKNLELRIPAYESGESDLIALFERPDDPPYYGSQHLLNFSTVYPDIWIPELDSQRANPDHIKTKFKASYYQWCKNGDFAIQYNCGRETADRTFRRAGAFDALKTRFAKLERHNQWCIQFAERWGYVETLPDRTVDPERGYPLLCVRTDRGKILNTVPLNYRTQGTAGWMIARAMDKIQEQFDRWYKEDGFDGFITLQVHDELVFDIPRRGDPVADAKLRGGRGPLFRTGRSSNLWRIRIMQRLMEEVGQDLIPAIPTPVGVEYHPDNYSEGVTL